MSQTEINYIIKTGLPFKLFNKDVCIGFINKKDSLTLGIDPKKVFNKSIDCSILIEFPLTKRQFNQIEKYLILIFNKKTEESKDWFKNASTYYGGKWQRF